MPAECHVAWRSQFQGGPTKAKARHPRDQKTHQPSKRPSGWRNGCLFLGQEMSCSWNLGDLPGRSTALFVEAKSCSSRQAWWPKALAFGETIPCRSHPMIAYTFLKKFWRWARIRSLDGITWRSCCCYFYKNHLYCHDYTFLYCNDYYCFCCHYHYIYIIYIYISL